ncbi:MAG: hypothetical protein R3C12_18690 [Planctomycetaceae bacterium]
MSQATTETPEGPVTVASSGGGYLGAQESIVHDRLVAGIRLQPVREEAWLQSEYANFCDGEFVIVAGQEEAVFE